MKVVIVKEIEKIPTDCDSCPFQGYNKYCVILGEYTALNEWVEDAPYYDLKEKGDCPLRPLPEKQKLTVIGKNQIEKKKIIESKSLEWIKKGYINNPEVAFYCGYNDCLDKISGED